MFRSPGKPTFSSRYHLASFISLYSMRVPPSLPYNFFKIIISPYFKSLTLMFSLYEICQRYIFNKIFVIHCHEISSQLNWLIPAIVSTFFKNLQNSERAFKLFRKSIRKSSLLIIFLNNHKNIFLFQRPPYV